MSYIVRSNAALPKPKAWTVNQTPISSDQRQRMTIPTRRAEITWQTDSGDVDSRTTVVPALPVFLDALSAFAQGTLIQTPQGSVAIEDLEPGMEVACADGPSEKIKWIGSMTIIPNCSDLNLPETALYRVTEGGYGLDASAPDLLLGPAARILPALMATDSRSALKNVADLEDGYSVLSIRPMSPVRVFHIALDNHRLLRANGVLVESFHPGSDARLHLSHEMFAIFLKMFPHLTNEGGFGPLRHNRTSPHAA